MADYVELNPMTGGSRVATDTIGTEEFQRVKLTLGADGVNDGDVSTTNPIPTKSGANSGVDIGDVTVNNTTSTPVFTQHNQTGIGHGVKTVSTAGTDEALAGSTACKKVIIQSQTDNTGLIAVGASGVDATEATGTGVILYAGDSIEIDIDNLADIYIDSTVNGEGVRYIYFT